MQRKNVLITIFPFEINMSIKFEATITFDIQYQGKIYNIFSKKPMLNGKAKVFDAFTPTLSCVFNKLSQKFNPNQFKILLVLNTPKRKTSLGQFPVDLSQVLNKKQKLKFDLSNGLDQNSFVQIGIKARFIDNQTFYQSNISRNFIQTSGSHINPSESKIFSNNKKRILSYDRYKHNPEYAIQRLKSRQPSGQLSSRQKNVIQTSFKPLQQRLSHFDSKRNFNNRNDPQDNNNSEKQKQKNLLQNENRQLKRKCRQFQFQLESLKNKQKSVQSELQREKKRLTTKEMTYQQQINKLTGKMVEFQRQAKQCKLQMQKKEAESEDSLKRSQKSSTQTIKKLELQTGKLQKKLQKTQEKLQQASKSLSNFQNKLSSTNRQSKMTRISFEQKCMQLSQKQQQNKKLFTKIESIMAEKSYMECQLQQAEQDKAELISQVKFIAEENFTLKKEIESHAYTTEEGREQYGQLKEKYEQVSAQYWQLQTQAKTLQRQLSQTREKLNEHTKQLQKKSSLIAQLNETTTSDDIRIKNLLKQLKDQEEETARQKTEYQQVIKKKEDKIEKLLKEVLVKDQVANRKDQVLEDLEREKQGLERDVQEVKREKQSAEDQVRREVEKCEKLAQKVGQLNRQLVEKNNKVTDLEAQCKKLNQTKQQEISQKQTQINELTLSLTQQTEIAEQLALQIEDLKNTTIPSLQQKIHFLQTVEIQRYKSLIKQQMDKITTKNQEILLNEEIISSLKNDLQHNKIQSEKIYQSMSEKLSEAKVKEEQQKGKFQGRIKELEDEKHDAFNHFQSQKSFFTQEIFKLQTIISSKEEIISAKTRALEESEQKLSSLESNYEETIKQLEGAQQSLLKVTNEYEELERKKQQMRLDYDNIIKQAHEHQTSIVGKLSETLEMEEKKFLFSVQLIFGLLQKGIIAMIKKERDIIIQIDKDSTSFQEVDQILQKLACNWTDTKYSQEPLQANQQILDLTTHLTELITFSIQSTLHKMTSQHQSTQTKLSQQKQQRQQDEQKIEQLNQLISELNQQLFENEKYANKLKGQLNQKKKELEAYRQQAEEISRELVKTNDSKMEVKENMKSLEEKLRDILKVKENQINERTNQLQNINSLFEKTKAENDSEVKKLSLRVQQLTRIKDLSQNQLRSTQNDLLATQSNVKTQRDTIQKLQFTIKTFQSKLRSTKQQNESLIQKLNISQKSLKTLQSSNQIKFQELQQQKDKISLQLTDLDKKFKLTEMDKKNKLSKLNSNIEALLKQNQACVDQLKADKSTLQKIQQTTIELDKMIISLEKDNKISAALSMPLKNILKKNEGIVNVNIKSINALTASTVKVTSPPSKALTNDVQSVKGKQEDLKKTQSKKSLKLQNKGSLKKSQDLSSLEKSSKIISDFSQEKLYLLEEKK